MESFNLFWLRRYWKGLRWRVLRSWRQMVAISKTWIFFFSGDELYT